MEFIALPGYRVWCLFKILESFQPLSLCIMPFPILFHLSFWISDDYVKPGLFSAGVLWMGNGNDLLCWLQVASFTYLSVLCCRMLFMFIMTWKFRVVKHCFRSPPSIIYPLFIYTHTCILKIVFWLISLDILFKLNLFQFKCVSSAFRPIHCFFLFQLYFQPSL